MKSESSNLSFFQMGSVFFLVAPQLTFLEWFTMPQTTVIAGEKLRTFSVEGDADVTDRVRLEEKRMSSHTLTIIFHMICFSRK